MPIDEAFRCEELGFLLSDAGYECAYGGKWHVPEIAMPEGHGFRTICGFDDPGLPFRCAEFFAEEHDKPFFLVASFDNPHNICEWRRQQNVPWGDIGVPPKVEDCPTLPANFAIAPFEAEVTRVLTDREQRIYPNANYSDEQWRRYRWAYFRLVEKVDQQFGMILTSLDKHGYTQKTIVIFTSDHGDTHATHHLVQKSFLYEEQTRVPFIIRDPQNGVKGVVNNVLTSNCLDMYATILDYAGIKMPVGTHGLSVKTLVAGNTPESQHDYVVSETHFVSLNADGRMVRTKRHKYIAWEWGVHREMLFDLEKDPGEMVNLAVATKYADVLQQHRDKLREWCELTGDTFYGNHYSHPDIPFIVPGDAYPQTQS